MKRCLGDDEIIRQLRRYLDDNPEVVLGYLLPVILQAKTPRQRAISMKILFRLTMRIARKRMYAYQ